jgi:hypothetical protein
MHAAKTANAVFRAHLIAIPIFSCPDFRPDARRATGRPANRSRFSGIRILSAYSHKAAPALPANSPIVLSELL